MPLQNFQVKNDEIGRSEVNENKPATPMAMPSKTEWKQSAKMSSTVSPNEVRCTSVAFTSGISGISGSSPCRKERNMKSQNSSECHSITIGMNNGTKNSDIHSIAANLSEVLARVDE
jgi:hypothetical protein